MHYATIRKCDVANGKWVRVSLFVSGCRHQCKECFNAIAWNFNFGKEFTQKEQDIIIKELWASYCAWLSVLGWEPLEPENQEEVSKLITRAKKEYPNKNIWLYSGFTFEQIMSWNTKKFPFIRDIIENVDVMVDGKFIIEKKDLTLAYRGSSNQRVLDIPASLKAGKAVEKVLEM